MKDNPWHQYCIQAKKLAEKAGEMIMSYYANLNKISIQYKIDRSPVTIADNSAHHLISQGLQKAFPDIPILSEEAANIDYQIRHDWQTYWLIDPLDGTKEFLKGNGEFTVNIALIDQHQPVVGVIYSPVLKQMYWAMAGDSAYMQEVAKISVLQTRSANLEQLTLTISRSHPNEKIQQLIARLADYSLVRMGSSLKTCQIAAGLADLYPRFGPTSEWDTAAAQCILNAAGGKIIDVNGRELRYNQKESLINPWFLAVGDVSINWFKLILGSESKIN